MATFDEVRPDVQMVADLVRTRIITEGGSADEADTFNAGTYPSAVQVDRIADQATYYILAQIPGSVSEEFPHACQHLAALYSAMLVEASYFREQLTDDQVQLYRNMLIAGIQGLGADTTGGGTGGGSEGQHGIPGPVDSIVGRSIMTSPYELTYQMGLPTTNGD